MSRSYKKVACWKCHVDQYFKRLVHRKNRASLNQGRFYETNKTYKHKVNQYSICDYSFVMFEGFDWMTLRDIRKAKNK